MIHISCNVTVHIWEVVNLVMGRNEWKWVQITRNGSKLSEIGQEWIRNGSKLPEMDPNYQKWVKNGSEMVPNYQKWVQTIRNGSRMV